MMLNAAFGGILIFAGWYIRVMWEALKDLQAADKQLVEKVNSIEILVAGSYIKRDDFEKACTTIFTKLDAMRDILERKADK